MDANNQEMRVALVPCSTGPLSVANPRVWKDLPQ